MKQFLEKLISRKLWLAIAGVASGVAVAFGAEAGEISTVAGAILSVVSVVTYIATEGRIDAEGVKNAVIAVEQAAALLGKDSEE